VDFGYPDAGADSAALVSDLEDKTVLFLGVKEYLGIVLLKQSCFKIAKLDSEVVSAYSVVELKNVTSDYHVLFM